MIRDLCIISKQPDMSCKMIITFKARDHNQNTMMLSHYSYLSKFIKEAYAKRMVKV